MKLFKSFSKMINTQVLQNIKLTETDSVLSILVIDQNLSIPMQDLVDLKQFGKITIAVESVMEQTFLIGKLSGLGYSIVLTRRIPIIKYDVLISTDLSEITRIIIKNLKIKYLCFTNFVQNFNLTNYYEFEENSYKIVSDQVSPSHPFIPPKPPVQPKPPSGHFNPPKPPSGHVIPPPPPIPHHQDIINENDEIDIENVENDESNYQAIIKDISSTEMKYDKYHINYLHQVVPGKVSIIMIVSNVNTAFAEVIRELKAQNVQSLEVIIIDNAAGFRNNVKPNIRYGEKMPLDFCEYHAKELTTGEYIFVLNQDSESFDIMTAINQGKYQTR